MTPRKRNAKTERKPEAVRQVSKIGLSFDPKPSLTSKDTITATESGQQFAVFYKLVKAGAKWGDIEVYDITEWTELLEQRQKAPVYEDVNIMDELVESGTVKRAAYIEPEPEPEPEPRFVLPTRPPCEVCGIYLSHSNPPKDFKGRNLCCLWCSIKKGNDHGDRCERCQVYSTSIEEY